MNDDFTVDEIKRIFWESFYLYFAPISLLCRNFHEWIIQLINRLPGK